MRLMWRPDGRWFLSGRTAFFGTSCLVFIPLTQNSLRLRSAGAHFVRRAVRACPQHFVLRGSFNHGSSSGSENGPPKADKLFDQNNESQFTPACMMNTN